MIHDDLLVCSRQCFFPEVDECCQLVLFLEIVFWVSGSLLFLAWPLHVFKNNPTTTCYPSVAFLSPSLPRLDLGDGEHRLSRSFFRRTSSFQFSIGAVCWSSCVATAPRLYEACFRLVFATNKTSRY